MSGSEKDVLKIIDQSLPDNSCTVSALPYRVKERYALLPGMHPLLSWHLPKDVMHDLIFKRFWIMSIYNPAFLFNDLRKLGFEIRRDEHNNLSVKKPTPFGYLDVKGMSYFHELIKRHFFPEEAVCRMIQQFVSTVDEINPQSPSVINLDLNVEM